MQVYPIIMLATHEFVASLRVLYRSIIYQRTKHVIPPELDRRRARESDEALTA
jgi:hypothetical protein